MIQLTYEPAFDSFHAAFRALRLRTILSVDKPLHRDHFRILDYYQLFPHRIDGIRLKPEHRRYKRLGPIYESKKPYGEQPDDRLVFDRMEPLQVTALDALAVRAYIDTEAWSRGEVIPTEKQPPDELDRRVREANANDADLEEFLGILGSEYDLSGPNGLKARTGLLEYRQDAV
ncbi:ABC-three component system middle component 5 [Bradyrhizobium sp. SZCCHNS3002]|uniref:ABC-three component system middle component 5 n=1 Tax=Bradyrhizobium sp. SZCCHNS3002 TaxID=3057310 RepID=UPI0028E1AA0B|nr:ABC-three component system middle component 5 [Bradyrhizobium sp. SZCCHNS3002]